MNSVSGIGYSPSSFRGGGRLNAQVRDPSAVGENDSSQDRAAQVSGQANEDGETKGSEKVSGTEITQEQAQTIQRLKQRDAEVRRHEMAHMAAGGQYVRGGPSYSFERGPDGRQYAVGGEVSIDSGPASTPEKTIQKMQVVQRAATAPGDPSGQDRAVAAAAAATAAAARAELAKLRSDEQSQAREESQQGEASEEAQTPESLGKSEETQAPELLGKSEETEESASGSPKVDASPASEFTESNAPESGKLLDLLA